ncbi:MAG: hypothetical protein EP330_09955 [Deltaproteobacteria bacterium]|nr:MAG: hypothetical protein EP330_09955 [Deltaproteobacteria bacterium]
MKDRDAPAQDELDALLDAFAPGTPFADEVETLLSAESGPVPVDEAALNAAVDRLSARIEPVADAPRAWRLTGGLAAAAAAMLAALAWWTLPAEPEAQPFTAHTEALALGEGSAARVDGDVLLLDAGSVRFQRDATHLPSVGAVSVPGTDLSFQPVGTLFVAGRAGACTALGVREGRVAVRRVEVTVDTLGAGEWWVDCPGDVRRFRDGDVLQFDAAVQELLAELRWLALPASTREGLGR